MSSAPKSGARRAAMKGGAKKFQIVSLYLVTKKKARTDSGGEALHIGTITSIW